MAEYLMIVDVYGKYISKCSCRKQGAKDANSRQSTSYLFMVQPYVDDEAVEDTASAEAQQASHFSKLKKSMDARFRAL